MLITEWSIEDEKAASFEEGREEGIEIGVERTAKNALLKRFPDDAIRDLTGIDIEEIKTISATL